MVPRLIHMSNADAQHFCASVSSPSSQVQILQALVTRFTIHPDAFPQILTTIASPSSQVAALQAMMDADTKISCESLVGTLRVISSPSSQLAALTLFRNIPSISGKDLATLLLCIASPSTRRLAWNHCCAYGHVEVLTVDDATAILHAFDGGSHGLEVMKVCLTSLRLDSETDITPVLQCFDETQHVEVLEAILVRVPSHTIAAALLQSIQEQEQKDQKEGKSKYRINVNGYEVDIGNYVVGTSQRLRLGTHTVVVTRTATDGIEVSGGSVRVNTVKGSKICSVRVRGGGMGDIRVEPGAHMNIECTGERNGANGENEDGEPMDGVQAVGGHMFVGEGAHVRISGTGSTASLSGLHVGKGASVVVAVHGRNMIRVGGGEDDRDRGAHPSFRSSFTSPPPKTHDSKKKELQHSAVVVKVDTSKPRDQLRDDELCCVCTDKQKVGAFVPCGHLVCCLDCGPALKSCPICRAQGLFYHIELINQDKQHIYDS